MVQDKTVLAIIPARGGSKGLPGKNIRDLHGRPLIAYAIESALAAETIDRVIVSTDDEKIARAAVAAGAQVPFLRPARLAGDAADLQDVVFHLIDTLTEREGYFPDIHVTILPTFPFMGAGNIDAVVRKCLAGSFSAFTVAPWRRTLDSLFVEEGGRLVPLLEAEGELPEFYREGTLCVAQTAVTAVYTPPVGARPKEDHDAFLAYVESMKAAGVLHTELQGHVVHDEICLIDVDTAEDLHLAQRALEHGLWNPAVPLGKR